MLCLVLKSESSEEVMILISIWLTKQRKATESLMVSATPLGNSTRLSVLLFDGTVFISFLYFQRYHRRICHELLAIIYYEVYRSILI